MWASIVNSQKLSLTPCITGSVCCGIWCCQKGFVCYNEGCIEEVSAFDGLSSRVHCSQYARCFQTRISVLSVASVERSIADASSRLSESLASARSKSSESATSTGSAYSNSSGNATLVGGAVGGVLGAIALVSIGVILCRRYRRARLAGQRPLRSQKPSSQPINPAPLTFPTNSNYIGDPPVINAAQPRWCPDQLTPFTFSGGATAAGQISLALHQPASTPHDVNTRTQGAPVIQQDNYEGLTFRPLPAEGSVDPRESYDNTLRGPTRSMAPMTFPYSAYEAFEGVSTPPPRYSTAPPVSEPPLSENASNSVKAI